LSLGADRLTNLAFGLGTLHLCKEIYTFAAVESVEIFENQIYIIFGTDFETVMTENKIGKTI